MLEMDGEVYFQSMSICRHLARKTNLAGSDEGEAFLVDMAVDALEDMRRKIIIHYFQMDSPERVKGLKKFEETVMPLYLKKFEEQLEENDGYLVKGKLSWADIILMCYTDYMGQMLRADILLAFPALQDHSEKVKRLPGIKEWIQSRPQAPDDLRPTNYISGQGD